MILEENKKLKIYHICEKDIKQMEIFNLSLKPNRLIFAAFS